MSSKIDLRMRDEKEEISLEKLFRDFEVVVRSEANEETVKRVWRMHVHEKLEEIFAQYVPWEFINELMEAYWVTEVRRDIFKKYTECFQAER